MKITLRLFAVAREKAGVGEAALELPEGATLRAVSDMLRERYPALDALLPRMAFAVNRSYMPAETVLHDGDEVAVIPPVSGG